MVELMAESREQFHLMASIVSLKREGSLPSEWEEGAFRRENRFEIARVQKGDSTERGAVE